MADAYWRYTSGAQQAVAPAAVTPLLSKRPRTEYDAPSGPEYPGYYGRDDARGMPRVIRDVDPIEASYERYLSSGQISSHIACESARSTNSGIGGHPIEDSRVMGIGGSDSLALKSRNFGMVGGRPEVTLPPDASNTLFVEGLPADCTRREVSRILVWQAFLFFIWPILVFPFTLVFADIFRPFVGYKEVRLVAKGSRHAGGDPLILCFVDFASPLHAAAAMDALQGHGIGTARSVIQLMLDGFFSFGIAYFIDSCSRYSFSYSCLPTESTFWKANLNWEKHYLILSSLLCRMIAFPEASTG